MPLATHLAFIPEEEEMLCVFVALVCLSMSSACFFCVVLLLRLGF